MILLGLHTSDAEASVAVGKISGAGAEVELLALERLEPRTVASGLAAAIECALAGAAVRLADVQAIVAAAGPGSFTGIRIGLATAKGLAEGGGIPLGLCSSLALLAMRLPECTAVMSAGRDEFYVGEYDGRGAHMIAESLVSAQTLRSMRSDISFVTTEQDVAELLCAAGFTALQIAPPDAATALRWMSAELARSKGLAGPTAWELADGNYLRGSAAKVARTELVR